MTNLLHAIRKQGWRRFAQQAWAKNSIYFYSKREHADVCIWIGPKAEFQTIGSRQDMEFYGAGNWVIVLPLWTKPTNQPTMFLFMYPFIFSCFMYVLFYFLMWFYSFMQMVGMYADLIFFSTLKPAGSNWEKIIWMRKAKFSQYMNIWRFISNNRESISAWVHVCRSLVNFMHLAGLACKVTFNF